MVGTDEAVVESELKAGLLAWPACTGVLGPWSHAPAPGAEAPRGQGGQGASASGMCRSCRTTHVLVGDDGLVRRRNEVAVIGEAIEAKAAGVGHRRIAADLGLPTWMVRRWLRRFAERAGAIRGHFTRWA
ncbi:MAG: hypothetical protein ACRDZX_16355 [Acidimicrobiales bacterium]